MSYGRGFFDGKVKRVESERLTIAVPVWMGGWPRPLATVFGDTISPEGDIEDG